MIVKFSYLHAIGVSPEHDVIWGNLSLFDQKNWSYLWIEIEAAKLSYNSDKHVEAMAEKLGVSQSSLNRWRREFGADPEQALPGNGQKKERDGEVARLKKKLKQAHMENEILHSPAAVP